MLSQVDKFLLIKKKPLCTFPRQSDASSWIVQYVPVGASSQEKRLNLRREETINCLNGDRVEEPFIGRDCARAIKTPRRRVHSTGRRETFFSASINSYRRIRKYKIRRILLLWELRHTRGRSDIIKKLPDKEPHEVQTPKTVSATKLQLLSIFEFCLEPQRLIGYLSTIKLIVFEQFCWKEVKISLIPAS